MTMTLSQVFFHYGQSKAEKFHTDLQFCHLFNVVAGTRVVREPEDPCESIKAISYSDIDGFAEYSIATPCECDDLRVAATHVQNCRVVRPRYQTPHLYICEDLSKEIHNCRKGEKELVVIKIRSRVSYHILTK